MPPAPRLSLTRLEDRANPSVVYSYTPPDSPTVVGFAHAELGEFGIDTFFTPFPDYSGPVHTALHGRDTIVVGAGRSGAPRVQVRAVVGAETTVLADFFAFEESFRGGVQVAVGDVTGDGVPDVIAGAARGGGPRVSVFDGADGYARVADFFAYDPGYRGGVWVGFEDDGTGSGRVVTAPGLGGGPHVRTIDLRTGQDTNRFFGDPDRRDYTQFVVGDLDGDALTELAAAEASGLVRVYDFASGVELYQTRTAPGAAIGSGSYFDYFGSTLLADRAPGEFGFDEFDLPLGIRSYTSLDFLGFEIHPGQFVFGTQGHPSAHAADIGRRVVDQIGTAGLDVTALPLDGESFDALPLDATGDDALVFGSHPALDAADALVDAARGRTRPLVGGVSVGGPRGTGTLTLPVRDVTTGQWKALSNEHVYAVADGRGYFLPGQPVTQPGRADDGTEVIGTTDRSGGLRFDGSPNFIDAALADLSPGVGVSPGEVVYSDYFGGPPRSLTISGVRDAAPGDVLRHLGRTTLHARHYLIAEDADLPVTYQNGMRATLAGQSLAHGIYGGEAARPGDSGSPVVTYDKFERKWYVTGQLFAGSGVIMVYTPIQRVLDGLGVSLT